MSLSRFLPPVLGLLMIDALLEVAFVGSMVGYLHQCHDDVPFQIDTPEGNFELFPKPAHLIVNQGHTSNGAAGTALILVGVLGSLALWRQRRRDRKVRGLTEHWHPAPAKKHVQNISTGPSRLLLVWTVFTVLSCLLTLSALIYTFVVTHQTDNQTISFGVGIANSGLPYPDNQWTPENWYKAVLVLMFDQPSEMSDISTHVHLMSGWRWNLIPLLLLGLAVACLAVLHVRNERKGRHSHRFRAIARHGGSRVAMSEELEPRSAEVERMTAML